MVNEYTTASYVEAELRADAVFSSSTTPTLAQVTTWIQEASREIELRGGDVYSSVLVSSAVYDYDGNGIFRFPKKPVLSSPAPVLIYNGDAIDSSKYYFYPDEGEVEFSGTYPTSGKQNIIATYGYGYTSTPLEIQRLATLMVAKRCISTMANSQSNTEGGSVQVGTISVSDPSSYSLTYIKNLNQEINDLFSQLGNDVSTYVITRNYD
jgi:hypothetical protein